MLRYLKKRRNIGDFFDLLADNVQQKKTYYDVFPHSGILLFCGSQGQGKTASAVQYLHNLLMDFPRVRVVTNMDLCLMGYPNEVVKYTEPDDLGRYGNNGVDGVVYLLDEIHLIWNSLESKSITPQDMIEFAQSRKQRRLIIGTSQRVTRIAKPIREQLKYVVDCHCMFGMLQHNLIIDMDMCIESVDGTIEINNGRPYFVFHDWYIRHEVFDTYQKMVRLGGSAWRKN